MKRSSFLLVVITLLFLITRIYKITEIPAALYWDEASIGYNAYSVIQTGRDEWGKSFPLHFQAFGEFKLPVYIYSTVISEKIFGLNELAVRLPAVLFSLFSVFLVYLITFKITTQKNIALFASFFFTISPWFFIFSRTGYEATAGLMFYLLGVYLLLLSEKKQFAILGVLLSFILSIYSYNSFRIIIPLTIPLIVLFYIRKVSSKKWLSTSIVAFFFLILSFVPVARLLQSDIGRSRLSAVGIFSDNSNIGEVASRFVQNYFANFNPDFLFFTGDVNMRSHQPGVGELYLMDFPLLILGIFYIFRSRNFLSFLPLFFLFLGPIPAAITKESPHSLRAILMAPSFIIISAFGVSQILGFIKNSNWKLTASIFLTAIFAIYFLHNFFNFIKVYPLQSAMSWQYPYKQIFTSYVDEFNKYDKIVISDSFYQPYIFALFYSKYDPARFRSEVEYNPPSSWGTSVVKGFGRFVFQPIESTELPNGKLLIFATSKEIVENGTLKAVTKNIDGTEAFKIYQSQ